MIVNVLTELGLIKDVVGEKTAKALSKQLGLEAMRELLLHFPRRYSKRGELTSFNSLPVSEVVTVVGEVQSTNNRRMRGRKGSIFEVTLSDGDGLLTLAFFNQAWRQNELHAGVKGLFSGKIGSFSGVLQLTHPDYELFDSEIDPDKAQAWADLPIPIYPATSSLSTWRIQKAVKQVLAVAPAIEELLPEQLLQTHGLVGLSQAIHWIHEPAVDSQWQEARESLKFHEATLLQLGLASRRAAASKEQANVYVAGALLANFDAALPFQLTDGQIAAGNEIAADLASGHPMNRMLQGEVGSGKTIVAVRAVLSAAEKGSQSALLAPTEVLASQHYRSILEALGPGLAKELGLRLLTGSQPTAERKKTMLDLASGNCRMVVGTHALISENVSFFDLGLVIIDEQHRFGVSQREALRSKSSKSPHTLVMTATPIPRTLAVTVFGDLDVSSLRELPKGRQPISTHSVPVAQKDLVARVWQRVAEEVQAGRQAFVVCPRIEQGVAEEGQEQIELESQELEPASVKAVFDALTENPVLKDVCKALLHGKLPAIEKERVMAEFEAGEIDLLVATTVIEVGVNVPNASTMVVLDADHFGLSQLHQLRGRVGRGEHAGLCLLVSAAEPGTIAASRLEALCSTTDGFALSESDLDLRGEGDVLGSQQSGIRSSLRLLRVVRDAELIQQARPLAQSLLSDGLSQNLQKVLEIQDADRLARS